MGTHLFGSIARWRRACPPLVMVYPASLSVRLPRMGATQLLTRLAGLPIYVPQGWRGLHLYVFTGRDFSVLSCLPSGATGSSSSFYMLSQPRVTRTRRCCSVYFGAMCRWPDLHRRHFHNLRNALTLELQRRMWEGDRSPSRKKNKEV